MKKNHIRGNFFYGVITLIIFSFFLQVIPVNALSSSQGAEIETLETTNVYGSLLYYPNAQNEQIQRWNTLSMSNWRGSDEATNVHTTLTPDNNGKTNIKDGIIHLEFSLADSQDNSFGIRTLEELAAKNFTVKFFITNDRVNFRDVTSELTYNDGVYTYVGDNIQGYKYALTNDEAPYPSNPSGIQRRDKVTANIYHDININLSEVSSEELTGQKDMDEWLDSKSPNEAPTPNHQKTFIVSPTIDGNIRQQKLSNDAEIPTWIQSTDMANTDVVLYEMINTVPTEIARTKSDANGYFKFSSIYPDGTPYTVSDARNKLSLGIEHPTYKKWIVKNDVAEEATTIDLGRLTDISRQQPQFETAVDAARFKDTFKELDPAGANATKGKYILTQSEKDKIGTISVRHVDTEGVELVPMTTASGIIGSAYRTYAANIAGYTLFKTPTNVAGSYIDGNIEITYVYKKNPKPVTPTTPDPVKPTLPKTGQNVKETIVVSTVMATLGLFSVYIRIKK